MDAIGVEEGAAMRVLVMEKADLAKQRWFELPPGFVFHFGNAWEEDGVLRFDYVHHEDAGTWKSDLSAMMRGDVAALRGPPARSTHVTIDLRRGRLQARSFDDIVEFPRVDPRFVARRNRHLWHAAKDRAAGIPEFDTILRYDLERGDRDAYRYGEPCLVEEHIVVPDPRAAREGAGWLVGCTFDTRTLRTSVNVFDALDLASGPVARVRLPYGLPPGFHGDFVPRS
jgi:carotenoid cleavage dioxygenase